MDKQIVCPLSFLFDFTSSDREICLLNFTTHTDLDKLQLNFFNEMNLIPLSHKERLVLSYKFNNRNALCQ